MPKMPAKRPGKLTSPSKARRGVKASRTTSSPPSGSNGSPPDEISDDVNGNNEVSTTKTQARKCRGIKSKSVCYLKIALPAYVAAERRMLWQRRWGPKPENPSSVEEMLRSCFWGNLDAKPRCHNCKVSQASLATGNDAPDGTEEKDLLPCGCLYEASLLELWCVRKGMFMDAELERSELEAADKWVEHIGPKTFGKHKMLLLRFWEMIFGPFDISTLLNLRGQREAMLKKFCDDEENSMSKLKPNPGYVR